MSSGPSGGRPREDHPGEVYTEEESIRLGKEMYQLKKAGLGRSQEYNRLQAYRARIRTRLREQKLEQTGLGTLISPAAKREFMVRGGPKAVADLLIRWLKDGKDARHQEVALKLVASLMGQEKSAQKEEAEGKTLIRAEWPTDGDKS